MLSIAKSRMPQFEAWNPLSALHPMMGFDVATEKTHTILFYKDSFKARVQNETLE